MGKTGPKPKKLVDLTWRPELAYAVGLIATDGCLSKDNLCIDLTSKDSEQLDNFSKCLGINFKISTKFSGFGNRSLRIQFKNRLFYDFLLSIGLTPAKSKTIGRVDIPDKYFFDFLRGLFDGDGTFYSYWDPRWRSSHVFYLEFVSASQKHINWLREELHSRLAVKGYVGFNGRRHVKQLKYAKKEALVIIKKMYYTAEVVCLSRKKLKIQKALVIEGQQQKSINNAQVLKLVDKHP